MKKLTSILLALVLALALLPATVWAADEVAEVNGTKYETLEAAVAAVPNGGTVKLLKNATGGVVGTFRTPKAGQIQAKSFTIDFGGYTYYLDINAGRDTVSMTETAVLKTAAHELTHFIRQNSRQYEELKKFVVERLVAEEGVSFEDLVTDKQRRESGLDYNEAVDEVVADACEMMLKDSTAAEQLAKENRSLAQKIRDWLREWVENLKTAIEGLQAERTESKAMMQYADELQKIWDDALVDAARNNRGVAQENSPTEVRQQARIGTDRESGKPIYQSNFPKGTPKAAKAQRILALIQNVWSKKPISLVVRNADGSTRTIDAKFDPTYSEVRGVQTDAKKLMGGNRHGTSGEQRVTLDLADDYYEIAAESTYNYSKSETGKASATHDGVKQWHYFINDILFQEYGEKETTPYRVTINVKERSDGEFVYSFSAERQNERSSTRRTLHADVTQSTDSELGNAQPSIDSIRQTVADSQEKSSDKVQNSARDSAGRELTEGQREYFKDSKVRDKDGNLKPVYHGSAAVFTEFSADFMSQHGSSEGQGFYFTDYKPMAQGYEKNGGQLLEGYLDIKKPLSDSEVTLSAAEVKRLIRAVDPTGDDLVCNYDSRGGIGYPSRTWYNRAVEDTLRATMSTSDSDSEILAELANGMGNPGKVLKTARELLGYDGYIVEGKYNDATVYVAFDSSQFKNADNKTPTADPDIRFQQRDYSYEALAAKPDMQVTTVDDTVNYAADSETRKDVIASAIAAAKKVGGTNENGNAVIHVEDTDTDVILSAKGLRHGLDRRFSVNAPVTLKAGEILKNAVRINELTPKKDTIDASYVLIGAAKNAKNEPYIVQFVVNRASNEVTSVDVLHSIGAKKEPAALLPEITGVPATLTGSSISISSLLDYVNRYFPDVLPESVLKHYGHDARPAGELGANALFQQRELRLSDRAVLLWAVEKAMSERSKRWSIEDLNRFDILVKKLKGLDEAYAELEALKEERTVQLAGRKESELKKEERFELNQTKNRIQTQKDKIQPL